VSHTPYDSRNIAGSNERARTSLRWEHVKTRRGSDSQPAARLSQRDCHDAVESASAKRRGCHRAGLLNQLDAGTSTHGNELVAGRQRNRISLEIGVHARQPQWDDAAEAGVVGAIGLMPNGESDPGTNGGRPDYHTRYPKAPVTTLRGASAPYDESGKATEDGTGDREDLGARRSLGRDIRLRDESYARRLDGARDHHARECGVDKGASE